MNYPIIPGTTLSDAIRSLGYTPPRQIHPGRWTPFATSTKARDDAGRCKLFDDGTGGIIIDHRSDSKWLWFANASAEKNYTAEDRADREREIEAAELIRHANDNAKHRKAAKTAESVLKLADLAQSDHPYLLRKQVIAEGLFEIGCAELAARLGYQPKAKGVELTGRILLAPVVIAGTVATLEMIDEQGRKSALAGGKKAGGWWSAGMPNGDGNGCTIGIAEGIATAATVSALTGWHVVAALSCGNMKSVAIALRARYSAARLVVVSDTGNGEKAAGEAASAAGADLVVPVLPAGAGTDFNDLAVVDRDEARRQLLLPAAPINDALLTAQPERGLLDTAAHFVPPDMAAVEAGIRLEAAVVAFFDAVELAKRVDHAIAAGMAEIGDLATREASALGELVAAELGDVPDAKIYRAIMRRAKIRVQGRALENADLDEAESRVAKKLVQNAEGWVVRTAYARNGVDRKPDLKELQLKAAAGLGKTSLVVAELNKRTWMRENLFIEIYVPRHDLADDLERQLSGARTMRGRAYGAGRGEPYCERFVAADKIAESGLPVFRNLCHNGKNQCPLYDTCEWIEQWLDHKPGIRIMSHNFITLPKPLGLPKADLVIVDENCVSVCTVHLEFSPCRLSNSVMRGNMTSSLEYRTTAMQVLEAIQANGRELDVARELGLTADQLLSAAKFIEDDELPIIGPKMDDDEIVKRVDAWDKSEGMKLAKLYRALAMEIDLPRDGAHGVELRRNVERKVKRDDGKFYAERHDRVFVHSLRPSCIDQGSARLLIDADASIEINRIIFGNSLQEDVIRVRRNSYVVQVWSRSFAKRNLTFGNDSDRMLDQIKAIIAKETKGGKRVLVVTNKAVRLKITGEKANSSLTKCGYYADASIAHFGNIRGEDGWKDFDTVIIIGRNQPPLSSVEAVARALWATAREPLVFLVGGTEDDAKAKWQKAPRGYTMADGSRRGVEIDMHPDNRVQLVLELQRECETVQAIDRLRLVHRETAGRVLLLCKLPVDVVVDQLVDWKTMHKMGELTILDQLLAGGACVVEPWDLMAVAHPNLFRTAGGARMAFSRLNTHKSALDILMQFCAYLAEARFRLERAGKRAVFGVLLHKSHVDPAVWLNQRLPGAIVKVTASISAPLPAFKMTATGVVGVVAAAAAKVGIFKPAGYGTVEIDDGWPAGGPGDGIIYMDIPFDPPAVHGRVDAPIGAFAAASTRTVIIDGTQVWITPDGRRWFTEPVSAPLSTVPAMSRVGGAAELDDPGRWLRPGALAVASGFAIGGRAVERVGLLAAA